MLAYFNKQEGRTHSHNIGISCLKSAALIDELCRTFYNALQPLLSLIKQSHLVNNEWYIANEIEWISVFRGHFHCMESPLLYDRWYQPTDRFHLTLNAYLAVDFKRLIASLKLNLGTVLSPNETNITQDRYGVCRLQGIPCQKPCIFLNAEGKLHIQTADDENLIFKDRDQPQDYALYTRTPAGAYLSTASTSSFLSTLGAPILYGPSRLHALLSYALVESPLIEGVRQSYLTSEYEYVTWSSHVHIFSPGCYLEDCLEDDEVFFTIDQYRYAHCLRYILDAMEEDAPTITISEDRWGILRVNDKICYLDHVAPESMTTFALSHSPQPATSSPPTTSPVSIRVLIKK